MLFDCRIDKNSIALRISSEKALVEKAVKACKQFLRQHRVTHTEDVTIVLRELTTNAMEHGNQSRPGCVVACRVEHLGGKRFLVTVEDEGPGFNYGAVRMSLPDDPRRLQHRGYVLIKSLSEKLEFNDRGNCVTAYVSAAADTEQIVKEART